MESFRECKPDLICVGKSAGGGILPVSFMLGNDAIMNVMAYGEHSSTFHAYPLACVVAKRSIEVIFEDKMLENTVKQGLKLMGELKNIFKDLSYIKDVRGKGLIIGIEFNEK